MAKVADYIVIQDTGVTIVPDNPVGEPGERRFTITLPGDVVVTEERQSAVLMFVARTVNGRVNMEVDVNAQRIMNLGGFNAPVPRTLHEVINPKLLRAGLQNDFLFRLVDGRQENEQLIVADIILWFQREPLGFGE